MCISAGRKTILIATGSLAGGGAERVVSLVASQFVSQGYNVYVLASYRTDTEYPVDERVEIFSLADSREKWDILGKFPQIMRTRYYLKQINPDIVVTFLVPMQIRIFLAGMGLKFLFITTVRNNPWVEYAEFLWVYRKLWNLSYDKSDVIQIQSEGQRDFFSEKNQSKCVVIPNPLNQRLFDKGMKDYSKGNCVRKFIAAARLEPQKNYFLMLQAFSHLHKDYPNVTLDVFGAGGLLADLRNWVIEHGLDNVIRLRGRSEKIFDEYLSHDVFLMSSDYEGMPNALMEAMAMGLACISTDCPTGPRDLIEDNVNGLLVPVGDAEAMYRAMKRVVEEPGLAERLGNEAYKVRERYPIEKIAQQWLDVMGI